MPGHSREEVTAAIAALSAKRGEIRSFQLDRMSRKLYETKTERELLLIARMEDRPVRDGDGLHEGTRRIH